MHRSILGAVIAAIVLIAAGLALALRASDSPQPASQVVVEGRVTGTDPEPVSGIKAWLNAWPRSGRHHHRRPAPQAVNDAEGAPRPSAGAEAAVPCGSPRNLRTLEVSMARGF